ncbi:MAG: methionine adenosyltransferase [Bacilli bacterium]|nr:methionine adenosyltransferase [Bacillales bacterium]MDY2574595.1 methionine adenosyltransferase [Bacilli bacterium]
MKEEKILFTSESVSEGHPDKLCDQISDAILDACLKEDPDSHVACECFTTTNLLVIGGEITTKAKVDYEKIARDVMLSIGYDSPEKGIDGAHCEIINRIKEQSPDINMGVCRTKEEDQGAGDQGIMFGYACNETENYMPLAIGIAHKLVRYASNLRKNGMFKGARPDMKSQVTIDYTTGKPKIDTVLMSIQHDPDVNLDEFKKYIKENIMDVVVKSYGFDDDYKVLINPTGRFVIGGPEGDTGLTGRKIIVDTYGGVGRHGGGCFSGKDPSKVDRSAAYAARYVAKNLCAAGVADKIEIQLSYAIGRAEPVSIAVETFNTGKYDNKKILAIIDELFDLRPNSINKKFSLTKPSFKYLDLASYGHFGRPDVDCPWEKLDKVESIKKLLK